MPAFCTIDTEQMNKLTADKPNNVWEPALEVEGELGNEDDWNGNSSGKSQWLLLEQINTGWVCPCIPSLPWKCSCSTGIKQIVGFDLFSAGLKSGGSIKSPWGWGSRSRNLLPSASFALLEKAQSCLRGEKTVFIILWGEIIALLC